MCEGMEAVTRAQTLRGNAVSLTLYALDFNL
jgi:hypothetical protein